MINFIVALGYIGIALMLVGAGLIVFDNHVRYHRKFRSRYGRRHRPF